MTQAAEITLDGVTCKFDLNTRRVWWMSDWSRAFDLNQRGYLNREWRNGHGDPYAQEEIYTVPDPYIGSFAVSPVLPADTTRRPTRMHPRAS